MTVYADLAAIKRGISGVKSGEKLPLRERVSLCLSSDARGRRRRRKAQVAAFALIMLNKHSAAPSAAAAAAAN